MIDLPALRCRSSLRSCDVDWFATRFVRTATWSREDSSRELENMDSLNDLPQLFPTSGTTRRHFLAGAICSWGMARQSFAGILGWQNRCLGEDPIGCIRDRKLPTLVAFMETQMHALWQGCPADDPREVACDTLRFASYLTRPAQQALCLSLTAIEFYSLLKTRRRFHKLSLARRRQLLNQGEYRGCHSKHSLLLWEENYAIHTAVCAVAMLGRLVTNSRAPARSLIGFHWSPQCMDPANLASVPRPAYPDLCETYDICVIGSGAGGAIVAARAAEAGKRVLIVEEGEWISPDGLVQRVAGPDGQEQIWPARDDDAYSRLFQGAGINMGGGPSDPDLEIANLCDEVAHSEGNRGLSLLGKLRRIKPRQRINMVQAKVVGGGPYVNNAIHLEIREDVWNSWQDWRRPEVSYEQFWDRMQEVKHDLGTTAETSAQQSGARSKVFVEGCLNAGEEVHPLPVSILSDSSEEESCAGCGSDNIIDPFGNHTGGLHPYRPQGPNSYLMRALVAGAEVAYETRALKLCFQRSSCSAGRVAHLLAELRCGVTPNHPGRQVKIKADTFVLAAGALASTAILRKSTQASRMHVRQLGQRLTANVGTVVYALFDKPVCSSSSLCPEPGVTQCFIVDSTKRDGHTNEPVLENWFHFPGSLAMALTGWFDEYVRVMRKYDHISLCGMVIPTKVRPQNRIDCEGRVHLELDCEEFELLLEGIRKVGRIYLAAASESNGVTLYLPTKSLLLNRHQRPVRIRSLACLDWAINQIRCRGPEFVNLATTHLQGGNCLGTVVNRDTFRLQDCNGSQVENLYVADASILPAGCEVNPQLTTKALAMYAADSVLAARRKPTALSNHLADQRSATFA